METYLEAVQKNACSNVTRTTVQNQLPLVLTTGDSCSSPHAYRSSCGWLMCVILQISYCVVLYPSTPSGPYQRDCLFSLSEVSNPGTCLSELKMVNVCLNIFLAAYNCLESFLAISCDGHTSIAFSNSLTPGPRFCFVFLILLYIHIGISLSKEAQCVLC